MEAGENQPMSGAMSTENILSEGVENARDGAVIEVVDLPGYWGRDHCGVRSHPHRYFPVVLSFADETVTIR